MRGMRWWTGRAPGPISLIDHMPSKDADVTTTTEVSYSTAPNQVIHAENGIAYAYREIGTGTVPLGFTFKNSGFFVSPALISSFTLSQATPSSLSTNMVMLAVDMGAHRNSRLRSGARCAS